MSKSVSRVQAALESAGLDIEVVELAASSRSAQDAADALGVDIDRIAKSIVMQGKESGRLYLFITAGGNQVCPERAADVLGEEIVRVDADTVRERSGFVIGGVAPVGHLSPIRTLFDERLADHETVWAAGGTPRHVFEIRPSDLLAISDATALPFTKAAN